MNIDIKLHNVDLPEQINFSDKIAIDCEFMGLNFERDKLCLVQISSGNSDAHIIQLDRSNYKAPNLVKGIQLEGLRKIGDPNVFAKKYPLKGVITGALVINNEYFLTDICVSESHF